MRVKVHKARQYSVLVIVLGLLAFLSLPIFLLYKEQSSQSAHAAGTDLYVSNSGSDSNDGSQAKPFATIQKASDTATPGTTVHVLPGNYTQNINVKKSGSASGKITFISDTRWGAKIKTSGTAWVTNADYIDVIGFDISGGSIRQMGSYDRTIGNHVHDVTGSCTNSGGSGINDGNYNAHDDDVIGNVVNDIGGYPTKCDYIHNIYHSTKNGHIYNNISYHSAGNGLYVNHAATGTIIANNLSFANAEYGVGVNTVVSESGGGDNFIVENNILIGNGIAAVKTWASVVGTHNQYLNNILFNNPTNFIQDRAKGVTPQGTITSDPMLVNYQADGSGDYHLKAGSPAIGAGVTTNAPTTDFDDKTRSGAIDIGPYQFNGSGGGTSITPLPSVSTAISPTLTSGTGNALSVSVNICPHGIGNCGDNTSATGGNTAPKHTTRTANVTLVDVNNTGGLAQTGTVTYDSTAKKFSGSIDMGNVASGQYRIKVGMPGYLTALLPGITSISSSSVNIPSVSLVTGDINKDNQLDILDYNLLISCFGSKQTTASCTSAPATADFGADLNDDSVVNAVDYNTFLRELSVQKGS